MRNKKLIKANEQMLERQLKRGFSPCWYVVYHLNDGLMSRHQQRRRLNPDEVSRDVGFHKHVLYQMVLGPFLGLVLVIFKNKEYAYNLGFIWGPSSRLNYTFMITWP